jgi:hypothetical protein
MAKWIKIETHTPDKAEIRHIARRCGCTKADAFLAFFRVYVWLDEQTDDGHVDYFTPEDADELAGLPGFGAALQEVRWILFSQAAMFGLRAETARTGTPGTCRQRQCHARSVTKA